MNEDKKEEEDLALGDLNLNIDIEKELSKIMCSIPITELMNVPSVRIQVEEFFDSVGQDKAPEFALEFGHEQSAERTHSSKDEKDPPVNIQSAIYERKNGGHPPFYLTLHIQNMLLHNCMLDSGATMNVIPLHVMKEMGLEVTRPYGNVCGIDSR